MARPTKKCIILNYGEESRFYQHSLEGPGAIIEMLKSTGLGPYLQQLPKNKQDIFLNEYEYEITQAYPRLMDGKVLLRFPRLFLVAIRR